MVLRFRTGLEKEILKDLRLHLKDSRYRHVLGVEKAAVSLARRFGEDVYLARIAALLHDNAKFLTADELLAACGENRERFGLSLTHESVLHAFAGAERARLRFGIEDPELLDAVRFHTTGRPDMTRLDEIIFIADYIEENRAPFEGLEEARRLSKKDLDKCCLQILGQTLGYLESKNSPIHPLTNDSYHYFRTKCSQL